MLVIIVIATTVNMRADARRRAERSRRHAVPALPRAVMAVATAVLALAMLAVFGGSEARVSLVGRLLLCAAVTHYVNLFGNLRTEVSTIKRKTSIEV